MWTTRTSARLRWGTWKLALSETTAVINLVPDDRPATAPLCDVLGHGRRGSSRLVGAHRICLGKSPEGRHRPCEAERQSSASRSHSYH